MNLRLLACLQLLAIGLCLTTDNQANPAELGLVHSDQLSVTLYPQSFDLRGIYFNCNFAIYEEGVCAGSWAVALADTVSDLLCIQKNTFVTLSPQQILDCVDNSELSCKNSTNATLIVDALNFVASTGLTTEECYPYTSEFSGSTGACNTTCPNENAAFNSYQIAGYQVLSTDQVLSSVENIKSYLLSNGSVLATYNLYNDLLLYNGGVYVKQDYAQYLGYHSIKILGWGIDENGTEYWIAANSWSINWGLNGYFNFYTTDPLLVTSYGIDLA